MSRATQRAEEGITCFDADKGDGKREEIIEDYSEAKALLVSRISMLRFSRHRSQAHAERMASPYIHCVSCVPML